MLGSYDELDLTVVRLRTGDYLVDGSILIERKTVSDFALSIIDTRLFKQATRLNKSGYRPASLIEGSPAGLGSIGITRKSLQGALIFLTLIFNFPIFRSLDKQESARIPVCTAHQLRGKGLQDRVNRKSKTRKARQLRILPDLSRYRQGPCSVAPKAIRQLGKVCHGKSGSSHESPWNRSENGKDHPWCCQRIEIATFLPIPQLGPIVGKSHKIFRLATYS